jgi:hypothetical protein
MTIVGNFDLQAGVHDMARSTTKRGCGMSRPRANNRRSQWDLPVNGLSVQDRQVRVSWSVPVPETTNPSAHKRVITNRYRA